MPGGVFPPRASEIPLHSSAPPQLSKELPHPTARSDCSPPLSGVGPGLLVAPGRHLSERSEAHVPDIDGHAQPRFDPLDRIDRSQRITAELEEIVVETHPLDREHRAPRLRDDRLRLRARGLER